MDAARPETGIRAIRIIAAVLVVATLYFARDILIPAALAILFAFFLQPLVVRLTRWRLNRAVAVALTVLIAAGVAGGIGYFVGTQFIDLSQKLPEYRGNLLAKVRSVRSSTGGTFGKFTRTLEDLKQEISSTQPTAAATAAPSETPPITAPQPVQVRLVDEGPDFLQVVSQIAPSVLAPLSQAAIVLLLLIFLLMASEDIRERLVWFAGMRQISLTTAALDEAGQRIGGYLRMQIVVNLIYGTLIGSGLAIVGVPGAFFWGVMSATMRFVPFLGPWIAGVPPTLLTLAVFPGWRQPLEVIGMFVGVELLTNLVFEPWLYGRSTGISSLGVVCAAIFWAWLWGPVGLVLSMPLTVCLLVLGKHLPQLSLLNHLFGDATAMPASVRLYQRLLAGDELTTTRIIEKHMQEAKFSEVCQELLMPVLQELKRDQHSGMITSDQARRAMAILDMATVNEVASPPIASDRPPVLCVAAQNEIDDLAATLLVRAAASAGVPAESLSSRALAAEMVDAAQRLKSPAVCLVQVAPISWTHCRHLAKTLAARLHQTDVFAVNIEAGSEEPPFTTESIQFPVKKLFRTVPAVIDRLRETTFVGETDATNATKHSEMPVTTTPPRLSA